MTPADRKTLRVRTPEQIQEKNLKQKESELHGQIEGLLRRSGITYGHASFRKKSTFTIGWPDFTFSVKGVPFAWEIKVGYNTLEEDQQRIRAGMEANGWKYYVIRTYDEALLILEQHGIDLE